MNRNEPPTPPPNRLVREGTLDPEFGWFQRWKTARAEKAHKKWVKQFEEEFGKAGSKVNTTVLRFSSAMARGMVMRTFDDAGIRRCAFCISIEQLRKRVIEQRRHAHGKPREKVVYVCPDHKDTPLPQQKAEKADDHAKDAAAYVKGAPMPPRHFSGMDHGGPEGDKSVVARIQEDGIIKELMDRPSGARQ